MCGGEANGNRQLPSRQTVDNNIVDGKKWLLIGYIHDSLFSVSVPSHPLLKRTFVCVLENVDPASLSLF